MTGVEGLKNVRKYTGTTAQTITKEEQVQRKIAVALQTLMHLQQSACPHLRIIPSEEESATRPQNLHGERLSP